MSRLGYKPDDSTGGKLISSLRQEMLTLSSSIKKLQADVEMIKEHVNLIESQRGSNITRW